MKKITSLIALLLMVFVCNTANADVWVVDETADGLIESADQITSPYTEPSEGSIEGMIDGNASTFWHSKWSSGDQPNGLHYFQVALEEMPEYFGFTYTRRNVSSDQITKWGVYGVPSTNPNAAKAACTLLAEVETPLSSQTETLISQAIASQGFTTIRFYEEMTTSNRGYFHVAEFQILPCKTVADKDAALKELTAVYASYSTMYESFPIGTVPGLYPENLVKAFQKALDDAAEVDGNLDSYTAEQIKDLTAKITETYEAVVAGKIPLPVLKTGYYFIKAALDYYATVTTEDTEDPETGEIIPGETKTEHFVKGMYDNNGTAAWKTLDETDAKFLWHLEYDAENEAYKAKSALYNRYFGSVTSSTAVSLSETLDPVASEIVMVPITKATVDYTLSEGATPADVNVVSLHHPTENNTNQYIHQGSHSSGKGTQGNCVGWTVGAGASNWYFTAVDEATALAMLEAASPGKQIAAMIDKINEIKDTYAEQKTIAEDKTTDVDLNSPVITSGEQFYSPYTTKDEGSTANDPYTQEEIMANLISTDATSTYWHSAWESGSVAQDVHYLQVNDVELEGTYTVRITRRAVSGDHITQLHAMGYSENNDELGYADGRDLGVLYLPLSSNSETLNATTLFTASSEDKYIRFYSEEEVAASSSGGAGRGYWHVCKFQIYPATMTTGATTTQATARATEMSALESAIAAWNEGGYTTTTVTDPAQTDFVAAYNAVIAANNAWVAVFADPTEMRNAIKTAASVSDNIVTGTDPGMWPEGSDAAGLKKAVDAAKAYNNSGAYTEAGLQAQIEAIEGASASVNASANKPQEGKWYNIHFDSEENYQKYGWQTSNVINESVGNLYDCVVAPAAITEEGALEPYETVYEGNFLRFISPDDAETEATAFRFVAVSDSTYVIQHKSGLFIGTNAHLSIVPAIVDVTPVGLGKNLIRIRTIGMEELDNGGTPSYLHAQLAAHSLCGWAANTINSNSALYIHDITSELSDTDVEEANIKVNPNGMRIWCYPVNFTVSDGTLYELVGRKIDGETQTLCFNEVKAATAGKATLYINGNPENEDDEEEGTDEITMGLDASTLAAEPVAYNGMHGAYAYTWPSDEGDAQVVVVARERYATHFGYKLATMASTDKDGQHVYDTVGNEARDIQANTGWIELNEVPVTAETCDIEIEVNGDLTAIKQVAETLNKGGKIYTIDGKFVGNGNINSIRNMGRGIYVVNGVKIAVK